MLDSIPTAFEMYRKLFKPVRLSMRAGRYSYFDSYLSYPDHGYPLDLLWNEVPVVENRMSGIALDLRKISLPAELPITIKLSSTEAVLNVVEVALRKHLDEHFITECGVSVQLKTREPTQFFSAHYSYTNELFEVSINAPKIESTLIIGSFNAMPYKLLTKDAQLVYDAAEKARSAARDAESARQKLEDANTAFDAYQIALRDAQRNKIL